jgi:hypothetical protein
MANPDCQACVTTYKSNYISPPGPAREPFGGCTDCRSFACSHHGHRRSSGGFICIRCDPIALVGSGIQQSGAQQTTASPSPEEGEEGEHQGADAAAARQIRNVLVRHAAQDRPIEAWAYADIKDWYEVNLETRELRPRSVRFGDLGGNGLAWSADPVELDRAVAQVGSALENQYVAEGAPLREVTSQRTAGLGLVGLDRSVVDLAAGLYLLWLRASPTARELIAAGLAIIPPTVNSRELPATLDLLAAAVGELR